MTKKRDNEKVRSTIKATKFLGLTVVSIDIDTLLNAFEHEYEAGKSMGHAEAAL